LNNTVNKFSSYLIVGVSHPQVLSTSVQKKKDEQTEQWDVLCASQLGGSAPVPIKTKFDNRRRETRHFNTAYQIHQIWDKKQTRINFTIFLSYSQLFHDTDNRAVFGCWRPTDE
jgi:hypothetical protein